MKLPCTLALLALASRAFSPRAPTAARRAALADPGARRDAARRPLAAERAGFRGAAALALLAGCTLGDPEVIPLAGSVPHTIAVVRLADETGQPAVARAVLATVGPALRARGYRVVPVEVAVEELAEHGVSVDRAAAPEEYAAAAGALGADAFLTIRIGAWEATWAPGLVSFRHDVGYRLWEGTTGELLWELRTRDRWSWDRQAAPVDPDRVLERYLGPSPSEGGASPYRDHEDVARAVHREVFLRLPRGPLR